MVVAFSTATFNCSSDDGNAVNGESIRLGARSPDALLIRTVAALVLEDQIRETRRFRDSAA